jgi:dissimilatory sulfite reductase (desulfoviridin) alpha/beta subunit
MLREDYDVIKEFTNKLVKELKELKISDCSQVTYWDCEGYANCTDCAITRALRIIQRLEESYKPTKTITLELEVPAHFKPYVTGCERLCPFGKYDGMGDFVCGCEEFCPFVYKKDSESSKNCENNT